MKVLVMTWGMMFALIALHAPAEPPNVILFYVDEIRWADIAPVPSKSIPTPNIDALARQGVWCEQAYTSSPWCSPSCAGLLTGRYPQRCGHEFNPNQPGMDPRWGLPPSEVTVAEYLKRSGYATGIFGK